MTDDIHSAVRAHYARAATTKKCGCGCDDDRAGSEAVQLYDSAMLIDLPAEVTDLSLGCGDPVTIASLKPGETVLDLGSGGGIDCFLAARQVGPSGHVIGVDMTPEMLSRANANRARLGMDNVEFRKGLIEDLPVDSGQIDVVMSNCVINLSPDKAAVFGEIFRVLKPGGRLAVSDIVTRGQFSDEMRADAAKWASCVSGALDVADYLALIEAAGFEAVTVTDEVPVQDMVLVGSDGPEVFSARVLARKPAASEA